MINCIKQLPIDNSPYFIIALSLVLFGLRNDYIHYPYCSINMETINRVVIRVFLVESSSSFLLSTISLSNQLLIVFQRYTSWNAVVSPSHLWSVKCLHLALSRHPLMACSWTISVNFLFRGKLTIFCVIKFTCDVFSRI